MLSIVIFCFMIIAIYTFIKKKRYLDVSIVCSLVALSIGTIMINVVVRMLSSSVAFPHDYSAVVNWSQTYYQLADFHFSYSYIAITMLILFFLYNLDKKQYFNKTSIVFFQFIVIGYLIINFSVVNAYDDFPAKIIPTNWSRECYVIKKTAFYLPVNAAIGTANISLEQNTQNYIFGIYDKKPTYSISDVDIWNNKKGLYSYDVFYKIATVGKVSDIEKRGIVSICARRASTNFATPYWVILRDKQNKVICRIKQVTDARNVWMDFQTDKPIYSVYSISFEDENKKALFIRDGLQIGFLK